MQAGRWWNIFQVLQEKKTDEISSRTNKNQENQPTLDTHLKNFKEILQAKGI